jgi:NAD(P)-dependent dehydrogenase (short-subunit alcohol dehydrogenase family)
MAEQQVALVTGAAKRIGAAIARELSAHGYHVAIHCNRSLAEANALAGELRASGGKAAVIQADLADERQLERLVPAAASELGPLTLLVNNASVFLKDRFGALDSSVWGMQFNVNLRAPVFLAEAFAAQITEGRSGNIINLIDQRVLKLTPHMPSYTLSKAALWTATQTLAQALAPRIRVNGIGPGPALPNPYAADAEMSREITGIPLKRAVDVDDIARSVRFLAETQSITGQLLLVDSGQHIGWATPDIVAASS